METLFTDKDKPEIDYPLSWEYKLILANKELLNDIIKNVIEDKAHIIKPSKVSKKGKYTSFNLNIIVNDEKERLSIFDDFKNHKDVSFVF